MHDTHSKGEIAQLKVELRSLEKNILVSKPTRHESRYDVILDDNGKLLRAQVKYASGLDKQSKGLVRVELRKTHKNNVLTYSSQDIDLLLVYLPCVDKVLAFKPEQFANKSVLFVRVEQSQNKGTTVNWYEDFVW